MISPTLIDPTGLNVSKLVANGRLVTAPEPLELETGNWLDLEEIWLAPPGFDRSNGGSIPGLANL